MPSATSPAVTWNPAVFDSGQLWRRGSFPGRQLLPYIVCPGGGRIVAGGVLLVIASGARGIRRCGRFASNGYDAHSPAGYSMTSVLVCEIVMTAMFLMIIMGARIRAPRRGSRRSRSA
jgi:aquaporin Z